MGAIELPVVKHTDLEKYLQTTDRQQLASVYLVCGEAFLCKSAFDVLLKALLPESERSLNYEVFDGTDEVIGAALERVNTYALVPGTKVVAIRDARLFYSRQDDGRILTKIQSAYKEGNLKRAARLFTGLLALLNLTYDDVTAGTRAKTLGLKAHRIDDGEWLDRIIAYCRDHNLVVPAGQDGPGMMQAAVEKGFPQGHHLILTTDVFDRRRSLYKSIQSHGIVIDCSVPKGTRQADKAAQEAVLANAAQATLKQHRKRIEREAYQALYEMTGFDLSVFVGNLQKLIDYVGDRPEITVNDVEVIVRRTKTDPIYAFTNALADRSTANALFFLDSLMSDNIHPLQILAAMTNQVRKLMVAKDFEQGPNGREWHAGITFRQFQQRIIPAIQAHDRQLQAHLDAWEQDLQGTHAAESGNRAKKQSKQPKVQGDLLLAKNPKNAYPVYQTLLKAANFSMPELTAAMDRLRHTDLVLKTTGQNAKIVIEQAVMHICGYGRI